MGQFSEITMQGNHYHDGLRAAITSDPLQVFGFLLTTLAVLPAAAQPTQLSEHVDAFRSDAPQSPIVRQHKSQESVRHIVAPGMSLGRGTAEQAVERLLTKIKPLLGGDKVQLVLESTNYTRVPGPTFRYRQVYKGLPVRQGTYLVGIVPVKPNPEGSLSPTTVTDWNLALVSGRGFTEVNMEVQPRVLEEAARQRLVGEDLRSRKGDLGIYVSNPSGQAEFSLAWEFQGSHGPMQVSAEDGSILSRPAPGGGIRHMSNPIDDSEAGTALEARSVAYEFMTLYPTNPLLGAPSATNLIAVDNVSPRVLSGPLAWVDPNGTPDATTSPGTGFHYGATASEFDDVSAYYHHTSFIGTYVTGFYFVYGFSIPKIKIVTHDASTRVDNQATTLSLLDADPLTGNSHAREAAIVSHESMHIFQYHWTGDGTWLNGPTNSEKLALAEATADFMGVKYRLHRGGPVTATTIGMYVSDGASPGNANYLNRNIDNTIHYALPIVDVDGNNAENQYDLSLAYSGALWDLEQSAFPGDVAGVVLSSLAYLTDGSDDLLDGRAAVEAVVGSYWMDGGITFCSNVQLCLNQVAIAFNAHQIWDGGIPNPKAAYQGGAIASSEVPEWRVQGVTSISAYPNPFNGVTEIEVVLAQREHTKVTIHDLLGRQVAVLVDENLHAGRHVLKFDATGLPAGVYVYRSTSSRNTRGGLISLVR